MSTIKTTNIQHPSAASPAVELTAAGGLWLGGGKILQVVRATDAAARQTTSTSFTDTGMSVTITPQKSDSTIIVIAVFRAVAYIASGYDVLGYYQITDASNSVLSGANEATIRSRPTSNTSSLEMQALMTMFGNGNPASTSPVTYKVRFKSLSSSVTVSARNDLNLGQMYAIEVSA